MKAADVEKDCEIHLVGSVNCLADFFSVLVLIGFVFLGLFF